MINPTYEAIENKIDLITGRLDKNYARLEKLQLKLEECGPSARRLARIARVEKMIAQREDTLDELISNLEETEPVINEDLSDTMDVDFYVDPITGVPKGFEITINDTPFDDTYVGGTDLSVRVRGTGYYNGRGWSSFGTTTYGLISGEYAPENGEATVMFGMATQKIDGSYPDLYIDLLDDNDNVVFSQSVYQDGVIAI